jgi:hypothetical protein
MKDQINKKIIRIILLVFVLPNISGAATAYFTINLNGFQAGTASTATGTGTATVDTSTNLFTWNISFTEASLINGMNSVSGAYFHTAPPGVIGPEMTPPGNVKGTGHSPITGSATISGANTAKLLFGGVYFEIRTTAAPAGEIRGQLIPNKIEIAAKKDNTIFEYTPPAAATSNGIGPLLIAGTNSSPDIRRGLIMFDVAGSGIPAGSIITSSVLRLYNVSNTIQIDCEVKLYRLLKNWGEGTSSVSQDSGGAPATTNDATWLHNFYPSSFWTNPGGDFSGIVSASLMVSRKAGFYSWTSEQMAADVQFFLDEPANNFGWIIRADETLDRDKKYFASLQNSTVANRPLLTVTYTLPCLFNLTGDLNNDCRVDYSDLELIVEIWLADCTNPGEPCYDLNQDNITNLVEFAAMADNWLTDCEVFPVDPQCVPK